MNARRIGTGPGTAAEGELAAAVDADTAREGRAATVRVARVGNAVPREGVRAGAAGPGADGGGNARILALRIGAAVASAVLGFLLVAQVQTNDGLGDRLATEREEDLTRILAGLSAESDRLQGEITELRLTLIEFQSSAEREELALRSLRRRLEDLQVLAGTVATEGEGVRLTVTDPQRSVRPEVLVDAIQELRDAGAEAIAINGVRLVTSSWVAARDDVLVLDGEVLEQPYRIAAVGPGQTMAKALDIPGGVVDSLTVHPEVSADVEILAQLEVPARPDPVSFVFGQPLPPEAAEGSGG